MEAFSLWWSDLQAINQWFYMAATFFSVFFIWQMLATMLGLAGGGHDIDTQPDPSMDHVSPDDAQASILAFKLVSVRSVLAFFTLFTWAGALYLNQGLRVGPALGLALIWGLVALVLVAGLVHFLRRMTETGNMRVSTTVGAEGTVYLDIPAGGDGEIRVMCSGVMTHLKARVRSGGGLKAGAKVRVLAVTGPNSVDVDSGS